MSITAIQQHCLLYIHTTEATGVSIRSVHNIHNEYVSRESKLLTHVKRYITSRVCMNPDSFNKEVIWRTVYSFYTQRQYLTLTTILAKLKEDGIFGGGRFCLWKVLQELGFSYKKRDNKQYIYKQHNILEQRHTYLQTIRKLRNDNRTIIYTDIT